MLRYGQVKTFGGTIYFAVNGTNLTQFAWVILCSATKTLRCQRIIKKIPIVSSLKKLLSC